MNALKCTMNKLMHNLPETQSDPTCIKKKKFSHILSLNFFYYTFYTLQKSSFYSYHNDKKKLLKTQTVQDGFTYIHSLYTFNFFSNK